MSRWIGVLALVVMPLVTHAATPEETRETEGEIGREVAGERYGTAVILCEPALAVGDVSLELRALCAKAYVGLGDKLLAAGSAESARKRWDEAVAIDPRLIDDPEFVKRLAGATTLPTSSPKPEPTTPATRVIKAKPTEAGPANAKPRPLPHKPVHQVNDDRPPANAGPRWDRGIGIGASFGFDGLAALTVGWLTDETILAEVSFGVIYPTADVRVRWLGFRNCITPFVGIGLLVPFGKTDRFGLDVASYRSLYELGEAFHVDLGVAYMPVHHLDLYAGVAFVTPFDQSHPDTVLFFPQFTGGASWYF